MKTIFVMALAAGSMFAQSSPATATAPAPKPAAKKTAKVPTAPLTIPSGAVEQADGSFRYVDKKGTPWIYRQTPFGVSRSLESTVLGANNGETPFGPAKGAAIAAVKTSQASPKTLDDPDAKVTAVAKGDKIEFTRPTPFGVTKWEKDKNDLTPDERKIWDRLQPKGNQ
jgi:hypothetical protein